MKFLLSNYNSYNNFIKERNHLIKIEKKWNYLFNVFFYLIAVYTLFSDFYICEAKLFFKKKINLNNLNKAEVGKNFSLPQKLPKYPLLNLTDYNIFENLMLNFRVNRIQAKEVIKKYYQYFKKIKSNIF